MAGNGNQKRRLSTRQRRAIAALLNTGRIDEAAVVAGVGERTLHRWLAEDEPFQQALNAAEGRAIDEAVFRLGKLQSKALRELDNILDDPESTRTIKIRVARVVLEYGIRMRELRSFDSRLARVEQSLSELESEEA
jgi:transposase